MYQAFYRLRESPFCLAPDPDLLYLSGQHRTALDVIEYGLMNRGGFQVVTGGIGTGKTLLVRTILRQAGPRVRVGLVSTAHPKLGALLQWILFAFDLDHRGKGAVDMFERFLEFLVMEYSQGRQAVLIIDEAQNLGADSLEQLRLLANINADKDCPLQVILVGQTGLRDTLRRPELDRFAQLIVGHCHLKPLDEQDTRAYIAHRLHRAGASDPEIFDDSACFAVFQHSGGVPRLINVICDTALVFGYAAGSATIGSSIIQAVVEERAKGGIFRSAEQVGQVPKLIDAVHDKC